MIEARNNEGLVVHRFKTLVEAAAAGFSKSCISRANATGGKHAGLHWLVRVKGVGSGLNRRRGPPTTERQVRAAAHRQQIWRYTVDVVQPQPGQPLRAGAELRLAEYLGRKLTKMDLETFERAVRRRLRELTTR